MGKKIFFYFSLFLFSQSMISCGYRLPDFSNPLDPLSYNADTYAIALKNINQHDMGISTASSFTAVWSGSAAVLLYTPDGTVLSALSCDEDAVVKVGASNLATASSSIGAIKATTGGGNIGISVYDGGDIMFFLIDSELNILSSFTVVASGAASYHEMSEPVFMGTDRWAFAYTDSSKDVKIILLDTSTSSASLIDSIIVYSGSVTSMSVGGLSMRSDGSGEGMLLIADDDGTSATVLNSVFFSIVSDAISASSSDTITATISGVGALPLRNNNSHYFFLDTDMTDIIGIFLNSANLIWSKAWGLGTVSVLDVNMEAEGFSILYDDGSGSLVLIRKDDSLSSSKTDSPYSLYSYTNGIKAALADTGEKYLVFYSDTDGVTAANIYCLE
ncbi:hypothetical protein WKV44_00590 [Spirochaetia bacterium 38H-sp]|uniref:Uncharacterized protein n=1 Tax=Rarispira pelagica TaxID=3141764 RepID=A0ABU9U8P2_9SPIR